MKVVSFDVEAVLVDCRFYGVSLLNLLDMPFLVGCVGRLRGNPKPSSIFGIGLLELNNSSAFKRHDGEAAGSIRHKAPLLIVPIVISIDN